MTRFFVTLIWLFVVLGVDIFAALQSQPMIGAIAELAIVLITLAVPYLRKKGTLTRYWGWLALLSAIWFVYLQVSGS